MTRGSYDAKNLDLFLGFKAKSQLCAWTTSAAVCVEGFCKKELQLCAQRVFVRKGTVAKCAAQICKKGTAAKCATRLEGKDLQLSAQIRTVVL